jgi:HEAT repeat protein
LLAKKRPRLPARKKAPPVQALLDLRRGEVTPALLEALTTAAPAVKPELIRAIGSRGDMSAVPKLLELARSQDDAMRSSSLQALALLAGPAQLPDLVQLVVQAASDDARSEAADALSSACQRIESRSGHCDVEALVKAVQDRAAGGAAGLAAGLLWIGRGARARSSARGLGRTPKPVCARPRCAPFATRAMANFCRTCSRRPQAPAMRRCGCWPCAAASAWPRKRKASNCPTTKSWPPSKRILDTPLEASEKRLVLSGLGAIPDSQALALAAAMLKDPAVKAEAAQAVIQIADSLAATRPRRRPRH